MQDDISTPSPEIAAHHRRWACNRAVVEGEYAVKAAGEVYLPRLPTQCERQYRGYVASVDYFPATQRTLESYIGLITRKPATLVAEDSVRDILSTITARYGLDDLSLKLLRETCITNFTGTLDDFPVNDEPVSAAAALTEGRRPFVAVYPAESILEVTDDVVRNRFAITRVRLLDDKDTVRELRLSERWSARRSLSVPVRPRPCDPGI